MATYATAARPQRAQAVSGTDRHSQLQLDLLLRAPSFTAGVEDCEGEVRVACSSSKVWLGDIWLDFTGKEELISADHVATETFHNKATTFQTGQTPSNAVDERQTPRAGFWQARVGQCTFRFRFPLPKHLPSTGCFTRYANLSYSLKASAQVLYDGERVTLEKHIPVFIHECWDDWQNEVFWESVRKEASCRSTGVASKGGVWMEATVNPALHWRQLPYQSPSSQSSGIQIRLKVKNTTRKTLDNLHVQLVRRLQVGASRCLNPLRALPSPTITELAVEESVAGHDFEFRPSEERCVIAQCGLPDNLYTVRGTNLFDIDIFLRVSLRTGFGKELAVELPIFVAHTKSLPPEALQYKQNVCSPAYQQHEVEAPRWISPPASPVPRQPPYTSPLPIWQQPMMQTMPDYPQYSMPDHPHHYTQQAPPAQETLYASGSSDHFISINTSIPEVTPSRFLAGLGLSPVHQQQAFVQPIPYDHSDRATAMPYQPQIHPMQFTIPQRTISPESAGECLRAPVEQTPPRPNSARGNRSQSPQEMPLLPPDLDTLSARDQMQIAANLNPGPRYSVINRVHDKQRRHSAPLSQQSGSTPPPAPSSIHRNDSAPVYTDFALPTQSIFLDTIGEDGESQAGTIKGTPAASRYLNLNLNNDSTPKEVFSISAQHPTKMPGSTSASLLEDLVDSQDPSGIANDVRFGAIDKTLPAVPDLTGNGRINPKDQQGVLPLAMDIFKNVPPNEPTTINNAALPKNNKHQMVKSASAPRLSKRNSTMALSALEERLSRPTSPAMLSPSQNEVKKRLSVSQPSAESSRGALLSKSSSMSLKRTFDLSKPVTNRTAQEGPSSASDRAKPSHEPLLNAIEPKAASSNDQRIGQWLSVSSSPSSSASEAIARDITGITPQPTDEVHPIDDIKSEDSASQIRPRNLFSPPEQAVKTRQEVLPLRQRSSLPSSKITGEAAKAEKRPRDKTDGVVTKAERQILQAHAKPKKRISDRYNPEALRPADAPTYDVKSARGGKGGKVTSVAQIWSGKIDEGERPKRALTSKPHALLIDPVATSIPLRPTSPDQGGAKRVDLRALHDLMAADKLKSTPMERPKDVVDPKTLNAKSKDGPKLGKIGEKPKAQPATQYLNLSAPKLPTLAPPSILNRNVVNLNATSGNTRGVVPVKSSPTAASGKLANLIAKYDTKTGS